MSEPQEVQHSLQVKVDQLEARCATLAEALDCVSAERRQAIETANQCRLFVLMLTDGLRSVGVVSVFGTLGHPPALPDPRLVDHVVVVRHTNRSHL